MRRIEAQHRGPDGEPINEADVPKPGQVEEHQVEEGLEDAEDEDEDEEDDDEIAKDDDGETVSEKETKE